MRSCGYAMFGKKEQAVTLVRDGRDLTLKQGENALRMKVRNILGIEGAQSVLKLRFAAGGKKEARNSHA